MRRLLSTALLLIGLTACDGIGEKPPNIVLISIDTLRWDFLNAYGYPEPGLTPGTTLLADNGIVYDNAIATAGTTVPSHGSMLTGLYPRQHGARSNFHNKYSAVETVATHLADAGYQTGAYLSAGFLIGRGLTEGFHAAHFGGRPTQAEIDAGLKPSITDQAIAWVEGLDGEPPFFLWLHLWEPHEPYQLTPWARQKLGAYQGVVRDDMSAGDTRELRDAILSDPRHLEALHTIYAGEVALSDRYVLQLIEHLEDTDQLDNTVVIFTADHGQALGVGGLMGHGAVHDEAVIRVPMIVADFRQPRARRSDVRVSVIDVAPTIAALAGLPQRFEGAGRSLLDETALERDWAYYSEVALKSSANRGWENLKSRGTYDPNSVAVYVDTLKMVYKSGEYTLQQTHTDWTEAQTIGFADQPVMADYLQGMIEAFHTQKLDLTTDDITEEEVEVLKSLGYTQ